MDIWDTLRNILKRLYDRRGVTEFFRRDEAYLRQAYIEIEALWLSQLHRHEAMRFVMISEAPLLGDEKRYVYNPSAECSRFLQESDLERIVGRRLHGKAELLDALVEASLVIIDVFPFALKPHLTAVAYSRDPQGTLADDEYAALARECSLPYLKTRLAMLAPKLDRGALSFFRYQRVADLAGPLAPLLSEHGAPLTSPPRVVSGRCGYVDREALHRLLAVAPPP